MSLYIAGTGWVTPLGASISQVWDCLIAGQTAPTEKVCDPVAERSYTAFRVPDAVMKTLPVHQRLRRASAISRFTVGAGLAALDDAGLSIDADTAKRIALVFAVANGGVIYTKRFYHDIVTCGAEAASPLLFPETVFNAAASHLAAIIGLTGKSYTVVGDGAVGLLAMKMAEDLMADQELAYCLVVAAEEADWLLCDAYQKWRLLRSAPPIEPFLKPAKGTILSEGAGAVLLAREGSVQLDATHASGHYSRQTAAAETLKRALREVATPNISVVMSSANGTFIDEAELDALSESLPQAVIYALKTALGESVAAGSLWQVVMGAQVLQRQRLPRPWFSSDRRRDAGPFIELPTCKQVAVVSCGLNQQVAALRLSI
jgi:3-oxoacyl-(acyl-carrier-protein) synthase